MEPISRITSDELNPESSRGSAVPFSVAPRGGYRDEADDIDLDEFDDDEDQDELEDDELDIIMDDDDIDLEEDPDDDELEEYWEEDDDLLDDVDFEDEE